MSKQMCDSCGVRPAKFFRRQHKFRNSKGRATLMIGVSPDHPLCSQCHNSNYEAQRQERFATRNSDRADFLLKIDQN